MTAPDDLNALADNPYPKGSTAYDDYEMREIYAAIKAGDSVVVPRVPTPEMRCKGREALPYNSEFAHDDEDAERVYDAMLAAAPKETK